ncbi:MAG TPA: hypothetical protein DCK98_06470 [Chloroflexi bacterium]|jgi:quercetin dioxygenase-like cupin family protein|nr:hypothetical protein [Chloroflexota bacterium]HAL26970.1 hypothetical protein [Chloroflexota bacterium]
MAENGRVFVRGISSEHFGLREFRQQQRAAPRVRTAGTVVDDESVGHSGGSEHSDEWWALGPGDESFLTQNLQVHFEELLPGGSNGGHAHQNEATFYILEGEGYDVHDGERYDWEQDDLVIVNTDSVHRHFNRSATKRALALAIKAKSSWMFLGLIQQGNSGPFSAKGYGPREDWSALLTPGGERKKTVVRKSDTSWETTRDGRVRIITSPERTDARTNSIDVYQQEIPVGSRSAKHWHMADEVLYVNSGTGASLHWDVEAEFAERYYAHVAEEPTRWEFGAGDVLYIPQNTVHQHVNTGTAPLVFVSGQNRLFKYLGYDAVKYVLDAPEFSGRTAVAAAR